ncbi:MAG TPA: type IV pilus secretin PilQ [Candidatus Binatia bacterium]|jgi:type IV pilus assembly protein PilQ
MKSLKLNLPSVVLRPNGTLKRARLLFANCSVATAFAFAFFACSTAEKKAAAPAEDRAATASAATTETKEAAAPKIQDLSVREEAGQTIVQLNLPKPISRYRHFKMEQPGRIVVDILDDYNAAPQGDNFRVKTALLEGLRFSYGEGYVRLSVDVSGSTVPPYAITTVDRGGLRIAIGNSNPQTPGKPAIDLVKAGVRVDVKAADTRMTVQTQATPAATDVGRPAPPKEYTGQKISLEFKDADIKNVFRLLAEVSGLNIIVTDEVNKRVTLRLVEVPWDQALDLLIQTNGLEKEQMGGVVRISSAQQLKKEKDELVAAQKAREDLEPLQTAYYNINYAQVKDLEPKAKLLLSKRGQLTSDERSNTIVVRDIQAALDDINLLIAKLDTRTPQVLIESNLIETTPSFSRALGFRFQFQRAGLVFSNSAPAGTPFSGSSGVFAQPPGPSNPDSSPVFPAGLGGIIQLFQDRFGGFKNLMSALEAAEAEGNVKIISRPSVVTLNNVPSTIRSQRILRIALPSSTNIASGSGAAAGTAVATEKIPVGIELLVKPQVSSDGYILMNIKVKSSSIANSPTVSTGTAGVIPFDELNREAEANVLVKDGETIVIGGILKDTAQEAESGLPYLKNVPFLGWLFKNQTVQKNLEELVVFITPRLASAGSNDLPSADQLWRDQMQKTRGASVSPSAAPAP